MEGCEQVDVFVVLLYGKGEMIKGEGGGLLCALEVRALCIKSERGVECRGEESRHG